MEVIGDNIYGGEVSDKDQTLRVRYVKRGGRSWEMGPFTVPLWWCIDIFQNYKIKICAFAVNTFLSFTKNVTAHLQSMMHRSKFDWLLWECPAPENIHIPPTERIGNSGGEKSDKNQNSRVYVKERGKFLRFKSLSNPSVRRVWLFPKTAQSRPCAFTLFQARHTWCLILIKHNFQMFHILCHSDPQ